MKKYIIFTVLMAFCLFTNAYSAGAPEDPKKHTSAGMYVTAKEAYGMWVQDKVNVRILDCRTPEEYVFVGHPSMAFNIPSNFMSYEFNAEKKEYVMKDNPNFVAEVSAVFKATDTILVMCRSGHRSAKSADKLKAAGFAKVYSIVDGFEGDKVTDKNSPNFGRRAVNGWRLADLPWTNDLDPVLVYKPAKK